ncbi:protein TPX2 [Tanacetum coccineum]
MHDLYQFTCMEEEKALKQLRRTLVPHARPVPNFNKPFLPRRSSKGVTKPRSPRLKIIERTERRKMVVAAATSSAASNMSYDMDAIRLQQHTKDVITSSTVDGSYSTLAPEELSLDHLKTKLYD